MPLRSRCSTERLSVSRDRGYLGTGGAAQKSFGSKRSVAATPLVKQRFEWPPSGATRTTEKTTHSTRPAAELRQRMQTSDEQPLGEAQTALADITSVKSAGDGERTQCFGKVGSSRKSLDTTPSGAEDRNFLENRG